MSTRTLQAHATIPATDAAASDARVSSRESDERLLRVVVCDDEASTRFAVKRLVNQALKCAIEECSSGDELRQAIATRPLDLLILDIEMPTLDGVEVLREIRAIGDLRELPVLVLSKERRRETVLRLAEFSIDGYLLKPLRRDTLRTSLDRLRPRLLARPTGASAPPSEPNRPASALVVDGDAAVRRFFVRESRIPGHVAQARSGTEALAVYRQSGCASVFVGGALGILTPQVLAQRLRALAGSRPIQVVRMTADPAADVDGRAEADPFDGTLVISKDGESLRTELARLRGESRPPAAPLRAELVDAPAFAEPIAAKAVASGPPALTEAAAPAADRPSGSLTLPPPAAEPPAGTLPEMEVATSSAGPSASVVDIDVLRADSEEALEAASQQVFNLLVDTAVERRASAPDGEPTVRAAVELTVESKGRFVLEVTSSVPAMSTIAERMLGMDAADVSGDDRTSVAGELARSLGAHVLEHLGADAQTSECSEPGAFETGSSGQRPAPDASVALSFDLSAVNAPVTVSLAVYVRS